MHYAEMLSTSIDWMIPLLAAPLYILLGPLLGKARHGKAAFELHQSRKGSSMIKVMHGLAKLRLWKAGEPGDC